MKFGIIPDQYNYPRLLQRHLKTLEQRGLRAFTPPRHLEVHLPNQSGRACNLKCDHCQGRNFKQNLIPFDRALFSLVEKLNGEIPLFILSGNYLEPTLNNNLLSLIKLIKRTGSNFGLHTNGTLLLSLEERQSFLSTLCRISSNEDYLTIALDAGSSRSFKMAKHRPSQLFYKVLRALKFIKEIRGPSSLAVRVTYLLNEFNSQEKELADIISIMQRLRVDSLRFSIPYAAYGLSMSECLEHSEEVEKPLHDKILKYLPPLLSRDENEKPKILYLPPETQSVESMNFSSCFYGHYMIALGPDGFFYRCSSSADPSFPHLRLGKMTTSLENFQRMVTVNQHSEFNPLEACFPNGARCTRAALSINRMAQRGFFDALRRNT
jgi:wyosine [tRNA(Phe)-imidazoG37] synthetase (radical SAM superfamily)